MSTKGIAALIAERDKVLHEDRRSIESDVKNNPKQELIGAAMAIITGDFKFWPESWNTTTFARLTTKKSKQDRLIIAAQLLIAEYDKNEYTGIVTEEGELPVLHEEGISHPHQHIASLNPLDKENENKEEDKELLTSGEGDKIKGTPETETITSETQEEQGRVEEGSKSTENDIETETLKLAEDGGLEESTS